VLLVGNKHHNPAIRDSTASSMGCNTPTPLALASTPVINGQIADPICAQLDIVARAVIWISVGRSFKSRQDELVAEYRFAV
jgi:hypothetical protein